MLWRYRPGRTLLCPFEHDNPEPRPECTCEAPLRFGCECEASEWAPVIECPRHAEYRVIFVDGTYADCCSPTGHNTKMVFWSGLLFCHPRFEGDWTRIMKYFYREEDIAEIAMREHPFFAVQEESPRGVRWALRKKSPIGERQD